MNFFRDFLYRLQDSSWLDVLPPALREPPGLWVFLGLVFIAVLILLAFFFRLVSRLFFGSAPNRAKEVEGDVRRNIKRDLAEMKRLGNHRGLGELFEDLGQFKKALAAYKKGDHGPERAALLVKMDRRREAKKVARDAGAWRLYAEICQEDGELEEAAVAFERDGQAYLAARCYQARGLRIEAARSFLAAGMEAQAVKELEGEAGPEVAELLDRALRASIASTGASGLSLDLQHTVRRVVQLWVSVGEARRAFDLAVLAEQLSLAVPVARDYLEPDPEAAELCDRAGAPLVAATIWQKLGLEKKAALRLAEHHRDRGEAAEAARQFEIAEAFTDAAEIWAAEGENEKAAELFKRGGDLHSAAQVYAQSGDTLRSQQVLSQAYALSVEGHFESDVTARFAGEPTKPAVFTPAQIAPTRAEIGRGTAEAAAVAVPEPRETQPAAESMERYQLVRELGRGGMGVVYLAEDRMLQRQVAYKVLPENILGTEITPEFLLAEARSAARLSHPNIVQIYDAGRKGNGFYIVMEFVDGKTLEQMLAERQMTIRGAIQVGGQILGALAHAHERQLIHRDLKPSNLIWGEDSRLKLSDFGLARAFEATVGNVRTQPAGTPSYMSPEQIRGEALSPQTDLYSFGCVMWEMLCRQPVFGTGATSFHHHLSSQPRDPREVRADIPPALVELILECLAKDVEKRPRSAKEISRRLAAMLKAL